MLSTEDGVVIPKHCECLESHAGSFHRMNSMIGDIGRLRLITALCLVLNNSIGGMLSDSSHINTVNRNDFIDITI